MISHLINVIFVISLLIGGSLWRELIKHPPTLSLLAIIGRWTYSW